MSVLSVQLPGKENMAKNIRSEDKNRTKHVSIVCPATREGKHGKKHTFRREKQNKACQCCLSSYPGRKTWQKTYVQKRKTEQSMSVLSVQLPGKENPTFGPEFAIIYIGN
jgi:hypothetical protein